MYKACVFDLDGTLTNTLESLSYSVNEAMKELGLAPITKEQCREFVGNGSRVLIEKTLREVDREKRVQPDAALQTYLQVFDKNCTYKVTPYPGVPQMLEQMKAMGLKLGVLSNKPDRQAVHVVETIFGKGVFDHIQGQKEGIPRKPDPAALLAIAEHFGAAPEETLYIGDSEVDAATGNAAHMDTVIVSWGFRTREELREAGVSETKNTTDEILEIIRNRRNEHE